MGAVWVTILALFVVCQASPSQHKLKYDQRQEGHVNVRADLENFLFLVIPTSSSSSSGTPSGGLLDFLFKTIPLPHYKKFKKHMKVHHHEDGSISDTEKFIESKTAPYHVDISRTRSHLAKLHPEVIIPENVKEEIIIARSPSVALSKSQEISVLDPISRDEKDNSLRSSRAILITLPVGNENIQRHGLKDVVGGKASEYFKKTLGISADAIEIGLAEQMQKNPGNHNNDLVTDKPETPKDSYTSKLEKIAEEMKTNQTVSHAVVLAKTIQAGLVEYFRKVAEKMKKDREEAERNEAEENDEEIPKVPSVLRQKVRKVIAPLKEKREQKEKNSEDLKSQGWFGEKFEKAAEKLAVKVKDPVINIPKIEMEPPKMPEQMNFKENIDVTEKPTTKKPIEENKENFKEELLLLGAMGEQCGPDRERDSSGICTTIVKL